MTTNSSAHKGIYHLCIVLILSIILFTGYRGIDFGKHWDEHKIIKSVENSARCGLFLPQWYNYPSMSYDIAMFCILPDALTLLKERRNNSVAGNILDPQAITDSPLVRRNSFKLRVRTLFLTIAYSAFKEDRIVATIFLSFPVLYALYMCAQRVMIVRNYLILVPFLTILSARGAVHCMKLFPREGFRVIFATLLVFLLGTNLVWLVTASESIRNNAKIDHGKSLVKYILSHSDTKFYLSLGASRLMPPSTQKAPSNIVDSTLIADEYIFITSEVKDWHTWVTNRWHYYKVISGSYELNFDYYPSCFRKDKVISVAADKAKKLSI